MHKINDCRFIEYRFIEDRFIEDRFISNIRLLTHFGYSLPASVFILPCLSLKFNCCVMSDNRGKYVDYSVNQHDTGRTLSGTGRDRILSRDARLSRNSTGAKEEFIAPRDDDEIVVDLQGKKATGNELVIYFILMVFIGLGNKIFSKLETIPMYNYPNFLNLLTTSVFIPCCFVYIIPAAKKGWIPKEQLEMPRKPFAIMGGLDACAGIMQVFSATYLPGPLLILLVRNNSILSLSYIFILIFVALLLFFIILVN